MPGFLRYSHIFEKVIQRLFLTFHGKKIITLLPLPIPANIVLDYFYLFIFSYYMLVTCMQHAHLIYCTGDIFCNVVILVYTN